MIEGLSKKNQTEFRHAATNYWRYHCNRKSVRLVLYLKGGKPKWSMESSSFTFCWVTFFAIMAMILLKSFNTNIYPYICVFRVVFKKVPKMIKKQFFFLYMKKSTIIENYTFTLQLIIVNVVQFAWMSQTNIWS